MFCPRCGRSVSETSNFCGGCGLSRAEIEKYIVKTEPQTEAAQPQPEVKAEPQTVSWESAPAQDAPKAESFAETKAEEANDMKSTEYHYSYKTATEAQPKAEPQPSCSCTTADSVQAEPKAEPKAEYSYAEPVKEVKNENLSTVDFIWMMIISGIPVVGLIYLIVLAFSNDNTNKRSYARASLIISIFASVIGIVFLLGFMLSAV
ncbi:MAG: hypothetical protein IKU47_02900 [Oscillospiraceae bacterium]|nr:hypothetical protein [Oscillospiraceae bacterium]